jgi:hypothetical protein
MAHRRSDRFRKITVRSRFNPRSAGESSTRSFAQGRLQAHLPREGYRKVSRLTGAEPNARPASQGRHRRRMETRSTGPLHSQPPVPVSTVSSEGCTLELGPGFSCHNLGVKCQYDLVNSSKITENKQEQFRDLTAARHSCSSLEGPQRFEKRPPRLFSFDQVAVSLPVECFSDVQRPQDLPEFRNRCLLLSQLPLQFGFRNPGRLHGSHSMPWDPHSSGRRRRQNKSISDRKMVNATGPKTLRSHSYAGVRATSGRRKIEAGLALHQRGEGLPMPGLLHSGRVRRAIVLLCHWLL